MLVPEAQPQPFSDTYQASGRVSYEPSSALPQGRSWSRRLIISNQLLKSSNVISCLTWLPSYSPSHTGSQTRPTDPPSGCISGRLFLRLRGNQVHRDAAHPSSEGTNSAAHIHSVSKKHQDTTLAYRFRLKALLRKHEWCENLLLICDRLLPPWNSLWKDSLLLWSCKRVAWFKFNQQKKL